MRVVILGIGIMMLLGLSACQDNIDVFVPYDFSGSSLSEGKVDRLFENLNPGFAIYEWDATEGIALQSGNGVNISIPAKAFVNAHGAIVEGTLTLNLVEMFSNGQMIIHDKPNVASGEILEAAGIFHLEVDRDGEPLQLADDQLIQFQIPVSSVSMDVNPAMRIFGGNDQNTSFFNWEPMGQNGSDVQLIELFDSTSMGTYQAYQFATDRLGWLGCNASLIRENQQRSTVCVDLPDGFSAENTAVFLAFQNFKGVAKLYNEEGLDNSSFCKDLIPVSSDAMIVVLAESGEGNYLFSSSMIEVIGSEIRVALEPQSVDLEVITNFLNVL